MVPVEYYRQFSKGQILGNLSLWGVYAFLHFLDSKKLSHSKGLTRNSGESDLTTELGLDFGYKLQVPANRENWSHDVIFGSHKGNKLTYFYDKIVLKNREIRKIH